jgi:glycosyltransferase involved in cell wall biosynthesis
LAAPATFYAIQGGNDIYWRIEAPAKAIGAKECVIPEEGGYYSVFFPNQDTAFRWSMRFRLADGSTVQTDTLEEYQDFLAVCPRINESDGVYPDHEGTAIWTRPDLARASHAKAMRKHGVRCVAEVDDNYLCDPKHNIFLRASGFGAEGRWEHIRATCSMDAVIFSTDYLRDHYHRAIRKEIGKRLPEFHVCRNNIDEADWPERVERDGPVRVGWMGSPSHVWDVDLAWPALLHAKNLGAETWMVGYDPTDTEGDLAPRSADKVAQWRKVGFKHVPWQTPERYQRIPLPLDIGLCPLLSNEFTLGKSDVKAIEYGISGAAVVAQNNAVYNRTLIHGETALLAGSPQQFLDYTELLIRDDALRERLVANLRQYIREERGVKQLREEWTAAL